MTYTPDDFRNDLICEIERGYDPVRVAQVAFGIMQDLGAKISTEYHNEILGVAVMEEGPQFEMTETQLREYLDRMVEELGNGES